ncbi:MAG TPA: protease complex subunit PrcB family protein [Gemmatimonadaceae bacterium]|nr:protease complex subunit PrcB family protein [Gemmatimonadaceae bacterium]
MTRRIAIPIPMAMAVAVAACIGAAFTAPAAAQTKSGERAEPVAVPIDRLRDGDHAYTTYSGIADSTSVVVRDSAAWRQLWTELTRPFVPPPPLPPIDFAREMVVVAALGARPTAGYDIVIEGAARDSAGLEVAVRRTSPGAGCPVLAVVTQPVDLARVPTLAVETRFRERTVVTPCAGAP